jgi:pimeloyl-ACP methyl ester carboxylesterase
VVEVGFFSSGDNELAYSCDIPDSEAKKTGIIFVHAADGNRLGPHRMFVELARGFGLLGYPTLRFDLSGCGDSSGNLARHSVTTEVLDVVAAIQFFVAKANIERVVLLGISRGALVCYMSMAQHDLPLAGMILLSIPVSSSRAALRSFGTRLREYICKLRDPKRLRRLLSGRVNIAQIWQTLATALKLKQRYARVEEKHFASRCPVLLIYGNQDPIGDESSRYYTRKCRQGDLPCDCRSIRGANHSFFHYKWKEEIFSLSKQWLETIWSREPK